MMDKITLQVDAELSADARRLLDRQERMERERLDFIADLFRYTANLVLTYDKDEAGIKAEDENADLAK